MTKKDLVRAVADLTGLTPQNTEATVDALVKTIAGTLKAGNEVEIHGFGKFKRKQREQREGRNPSTGEKITIAARKVAHFTPAKALADAVA